MGVDRASALARGLDFNPLGSRLDRVFGVNTLYDEVGMSVEITILRQGSCMFRNARRQQIREEARHNGWPQKVVEAFKSFLQQPAVYIKEQVVNILHCDLEVLEAQLEREMRVSVKLVPLRSISISRHSDAG